MNEPPEITAALAGIEKASKSPRQLAREAIAKFKLDREKGEKPLPVATTTDGKGAPLLDVNAVLRKSEPNHAR